MEDEADARRMFRSFERRFKDFGIGIDLKTSKILEVGSGKSVFLDYLQKQGVDAVGVDARPRGETEGLPIVAARIEQLPFPDETFDVVLSNSVFDTSVYDQDHRLMLEEISRVLRPGGVYAGTANFIEGTAAGLTEIHNSEGFVGMFRKS